MGFLDTVKQVMKGRSSMVERGIDVAVERIGRFSTTLEQKAGTAKAKARSLDPDRSGEDPASSDAPPSSTKAPSSGTTVPEAPPSGTVPPEAPEAPSGTTAPEAPRETEAPPGETASESKKPKGSVLRGDLASVTDADEPTTAGVPTPPTDGPGSAGDAAPPA